MPWTRAMDGETDDSRQEPQAEVSDAGDEGYSFDGFKIVFAIKVSLMPVDPAGELPRTTANGGLQK